MACTALTKGRTLDCKRQSGGVKFLYFSVFDDISDSDITYNAAAGVHEISAINFQSSTIYRYAVPRGSTTVNEAITGSTENGTLFYTPTVNLVLNRLTKEDQNEIKLLGQTQVRIFAQLNAQTDNGNDVIVVLGAKNGLSMNAGTADSGAAFGDRNGYTLTFDGLEAEPFPFLKDPAAGTAPFGDAGITNVTIDTN
ncbi:MAG: hypothetical protein GOVbin2006_3 [Prokaryotic dsDNA virus sp.]|nr:MAG: hypothetical protein GOVbin2006_3 [Prokaryotic dsDNA virus sp.]|tara:strand:+ start:248 stop:835 length:588 start_codon:yes stop_codon:yes gene_type:complete